jgi:hypothetical protein
MECVAVCPAKEALVISVSRKTIPIWTVAAMIALLFFGPVGYAKLNGHWDTRLPQQVYFQLVPQASQTQHP